MNILGIDFGTKRIGLAWADSDMGLVLPFGVVKNNEKIVPEELLKRIKEERIEKVVVGLPKSLEGGNDNKNMERVSEFVKELSKNVDIPVDTLDERLTSQAADRFPGDISRDEKSAMVLLQNYIDKNN